MFELSQQKTWLGQNYYFRCILILGQNTILKSLGTKLLDNSYIYIINNI